MLKADYMHNREIIRNEDIYEGRNFQLVFEKHPYIEPNCELCIIMQ